MADGAARRPRPGSRRGADATGTARWGRAECWAMEAGEDRVLYFAYGSNLLRERLLLRNPSAALYSRGRLQVRAGRAAVGEQIVSGEGSSGALPWGCPASSVGSSCVLPCLQGLVQGPYGRSVPIRARVYVCNQSCAAL